MAVFQSVLDDEEPVYCDEKERKGYNLLAAAQCNNIDEVIKILDNDPDLVHFRDSDGYSPLHRAAHNNHVDTMKQLLKRCARIDARTNDGWQPLHSAVRWNMVEAADLLIRCGADVNALTNGHVTPLHLAASRVDSRKILLMILTHPEIDPSVVDGAGETARDIAHRTSINVKLFDMFQPSLCPI